MKKNMFGYEGALILWFFDDFRNISYDIKWFDQSDFDDVAEK